MELYEHYIEFDNGLWYRKDGLEPAHFFDFKIIEHTGVFEKTKSFYGNLNWKNEKCEEYKLINKTDFNKLLVENKKCARIRIGFKYWSGEKLTERQFKDIVKKFIIDNMTDSLSKDSL